MHKTEVPPAPCVVCGKGRTPDADGNMPVFVDLERDVNWNDPVVMCEDCITKSGALVDLMSAEERRELEREIHDRDTQIHELKAELEQVEARARQAIRRARAA